jgi:hypothetical protein
MRSLNAAVYPNVDEKPLFRSPNRGEPPCSNVAGAGRFEREDIDLWFEQRGASPATRGPKRTQAGLCSGARP